MSSTRTPQTPLTCKSNTQDLDTLTRCLGFFFRVEIRGYNETPTESSLMSNSFELNPEWPQRHFAEAPEEVHISPRTAYFVRDGKLMARRLERLDDDQIADAWKQLTEEGIENPLL